MSAQHTPGPWYADKLVDQSHYFIRDQSGHKIVAEAHSGNELHASAFHVRKNALLMAAAPDMLAALLLITQADPCIAETTDDELRAAMEDEGEEQEVRDQARAFLAARASIAKATGGQA